MRLTLDWNCVIEVEEGREQSSDVSSLISAHRSGQLEVAILATSASENTKSKLFPGNARFFKERVAQLGWEDLPIVPMPGVLGLSYIGYCYWVGDREKFTRDFEALWQVIAPNVASRPNDHIGSETELTDELIQSSSLSRWRNTWCDVMSAYTHIAEERDVFVTLNTKDFQKNATGLARLGMKCISDPRGIPKVVAKNSIS